MSSDSIKDNNTPHFADARTNHSYLRAHENGHTDKYREYLAHQDEPADNSRNPRNLFHESNIVDTYWLNIARANLSRNK